MTRCCLCCSQGFLLVCGLRYFSCDVSSLTTQRVSWVCGSLLFSRSGEFEATVSQTSSSSFLPLPLVPLCHSAGPTRVSQVLAVLSLCNRLQRSPSSLTLSSDSLHSLPSSYSEFSVIVCFNFKFSIWLFKKFSFLIFSIWCYEQSITFFFSSVTILIMAVLKLFVNLTFGHSHRKFLLPDFFFLVYRSYLTVSLPALWFFIENWAF